MHTCTVPLVQWSTHLLPVMRDAGSIPRRYLCETRILLLALSHYIGDPDVIDHCGLIRGGLRPEPSLGHRADNVIIPLDLTQLFCPGFTLAAGPPSGFTTTIVGCRGGALWRACNLTSPQFHWSSGPPVCFLSKGTRVQSPGGYLCETGILLLALSCYSVIIFCYNFKGFIFVVTFCYNFNVLVFVIIFPVWFFHVCYILCYRHPFFS